MVRTAHGLRGALLAHLTHTGGSSATAGRPPCRQAGCRVRCCQWRSRRRGTPVASTRPQVIGETEVNASADGRCSQAGAARSTEPLITAAPPGKCVPSQNVQ